MKHAFDTERLRVFEGVVKPGDECEEKTLLVAFWLVPEYPKPVATALLWDARTAALGKWVLDWLRSLVWTVAEE